MTKEELERIKVAYHSGLKVQIWFNGNWKNFDAREYSMYKDPFSENRQYRIVGSDYADMAEKRIAELEKENTELKDNFKIAKDNEYEYQSLLTKAKELLRYYFDCFKNDNKYTLSDFEVVEDTEQFLNSEVEK